MDEPETEGKCVAKNTFESASLSESYWQGKQTIPLFTDDHIKNNIQ